MLSHHDYLIATAHYLDAIIYRILGNLEPNMSAEADAARTSLDALANAIDTVLANLASSKAAVAQAETDAASDKQALADLKSQFDALVTKIEQGV